MRENTSLANRRVAPRNNGFTLIELMIVVAVIGILAAIALPAYRDFTVRSKVSEGLVFASAAKIAVVESYSSRGVLPSSNADAGLSEPETITSQYTDQTEIKKVGESHQIWVTFNKETVPQLDGGSVILAATLQGGAITWCCYSDDKIDARYLPASCRGSEKCGSVALTEEEKQVANCIQVVGRGRPSCRRDDMGIDCPPGYAPPGNAIGTTPICLGGLIRR